MQFLSSFLSLESSHHGMQQCQNVEDGGGKERKNKILHARSLARLSRTSAAKTLERQAPPPPPPPPPTTHPLSPTAHHPPSQHRCRSSNVRCVARPSTLIMDDWGSPWADDDSADPPPSIRNHLGSPPAAFADISDTTSSTTNSLHNNNTHATCNNGDALAGFPPTTVAHRLQPDPWAAPDGALGDSAAWADASTPVVEGGGSANGGGGGVGSHLWATRGLSPAVAAGHEHWADWEAPPPSQLPHSPPSGAVAKAELPAANRDSAVRGDESGQASARKPEGEQSKAKDGKSTTPIPAAGDDDDFGDFAEEADFDDFDEQTPAPEPPAAPQAVPAAGTTPAFTIDPAVVQKLYPIPTSAPSLPALEEGVIHTVGA